MQQEETAGVSGGLWWETWRALRIPYVFTPSIILTNSEFLLAAAKNTKKKKKENLKMFLKGEEI